MENPLPSAAYKECLTPCIETQFSLFSIRERLRQRAAPHILISLNWVRTSLNPIFQNFVGFAKQRICVSYSDHNGILPPHPSSCLKGLRPLIPELCNFQKCLKTINSYVPKPLFGSRGSVSEGGPAIVHNGIHSVNKIYKLHGES